MWTSGPTATLHPVRALTLLVPQRFADPVDAEQLNKRLESKCKALIALEEQTIPTRPIVSDACSRCTLTRTSHTQSMPGHARIVPPATADASKCRAS